MDFTNLKIPVHRLAKDKNWSDKYPDLSLYYGKVSEGLPDGIAVNDVLKFLYLCWSQESPFQQVQNVGTRISRVLKHIGVDPNDNGVYDDNWNEILVYKNDSYRKMFVYFLLTNYPARWTQLVSATTDMGELVSRPVPETELENQQRAKTRQSLADEIDNTLTVFTQKAGSLLVELEVQRFVAHDVLGIRPEEYMDMAPKPVMPHLMRNDMMFPEIDG